jgi:PRTRC genetic system protein E
MTEEFKKKINSTAVRTLVDQILDDFYKDAAEKEYVVSVVKNRFVTIAEKLKELETLKANQPKNDDINPAHIELEQNYAILETKFKEIDAAKTAIETQLNEILAEKENVESLVMEQEQKILDLEDKLKESSQQPSTGSIGFFEELFHVLPDVVGVKMIINKEGNKALVTTYPEPKVNDTDFVAALPPILFEGTSQELDSEFVPALCKAMESVGKVTLQIADYEKSVSEALAKSKMEAEKNKPKSTPKTPSKKKTDQPSIFKEEDEEKDSNGDETSDETELPETGDSELF